MKIRVFYDYHEGNLVLQKYMITFRKGELPWANTLRSYHSIHLCSLAKYLHPCGKLEAH